jgi:hypothetical protein
MADEVKIRALGFTPEEQATLKNTLGADPSAAPTAAGPSMIGTGNTQIINGSDPRFALSQLASGGGTAPGSVYIAPADLVSQAASLKESHVTCLVAGLATTPSIFLKLATRWQAQAEALNVFQGLDDQGKVKTLGFVQEAEWTGFADKMIAFLTKFGIPPDKVTQALRSLGPLVVGLKASVDTFMSAELFALRTVLAEAPVDTGSLWNGFSAVLSGQAATTLTTQLFSNADAILLEKRQAGWHICVTYFLKTRPTLPSFCVRLSESGPSNAFATIDPNAILATPEGAPAANPASPPLPGPIAAGVDPAAMGLPNMGATNFSDASNTVDVFRQNEKLKADLAALQAQLTKQESFNTIHIQANKILGEELKRLIRSRKEPTTDEELKSSKKQNELKIKKLLIRITQYDDNLKELTQLNESLKSQLDLALKERETTQQEVRRLEETLAKDRAA